MYAKYTKVTDIQRNILKMRRNDHFAEKLTTSSGSSSRSSYCVVTDPVSMSMTTTSAMSAGRIFYKHAAVNHDNATQTHTRHMYNMQQIHQDRVYKDADICLLSVSLPHPTAQH